MSKRYRKTKLAFLGLSLLSSSLAQAIDLQEFDRLAAERTQITNEENRLKTEASDLEFLSAELGAIRSLQNDQLVGPQSVKVRYEKWLGEAEQWLSQWKTLATASRDVNKLNIASFGAELQAALKSCNQTYARLAEEGYVLYEKSGTLESQLAARPELEPTRWGQQAEFVKALNEQKKRSLSSLSTLRQQLSPARIEGIRQDVAKVQDLIETRLMKIALDFPELREKVSLIREQLRFAAEIEPTLVAFEARGNRLIGLVDDGYLAIAQLELAAVKQAAEPILAKIRGFDGDEKAKALLLGRTQQVSGKAQRSLQEQLESGSRRSLFVNFVQPKRIALTKICREHGAKSQIDCELLRLLNQVPVNSDSVQKWSPADLQYFELQLFKVENGPEKLPLGARL